jgi:hypothetical protein
MREDIEMNHIGLLVNRGNFINDDEIYVRDVHTTCGDISGDQHFGCPTPELGHGFVPKITIHIAMVHRTGVVLRKMQQICANAYKYKGDRGEEQRNWLGNEERLSNGEV